MTKEKQRDKNEFNEGRGGTRVPTQKFVPKMPTTKPPLSKKDSKKNRKLEKQQGKE